MFVFPAESVRLRFLFTQPDAVALCNNEICSETSILECVGESFKDGLKI